MNITIKSRIISGNLGDCWADNNAVADELAEFTKKIWGNDLKKFSDCGHEVEVLIKPLYNHNGACAQTTPAISVSSENIEEETHAIYPMDDDLTDTSLIFELFCRSEIAKKYALE
jgi:hypothetical protein